MSALRHFRLGATLLVAGAAAACGASDGPGGLAQATGGAPASGGAPSGGANTGGAPLASTGGLPIIIPVTPSGKRSCHDHDISVLFLIDRSGSMNCNLPPTTASAECEAMSPPAKVNEAEKSKWEIVSEVLGASLDLLVTTDPDIRVRAAATYFSVDGNCGATSSPSVPMAAVSDELLGAIRSSLAAQKPAGGTPIVGGSMLAYKYLYQTLAVDGNAHVVLITDGADSCGSYYSANPAIGPGDHIADLIGVQAPKAAGYGIQTWVIGAPGSEPARATLSNLAIAGTTRRSDACVPGSASDPTVGDCHYDMTTGDFRTALEGALAHIMEVVTCRDPR
jgi:hypothetical protein